MENEMEGKKVRRSNIACPEPNCGGTKLKSIYINNNKHMESIEGVYFCTNCKKTFRPNFEAI
jgi:transposase-like protein